MEHNREQENKKIEHDMRSRKGIKVHIHKSKSEELKPKFWLK